MEVVTVTFGADRVAPCQRRFLSVCPSKTNKSIDFFTALGYTFNPQFTDENATCMIIGEDIHALLLVENFFKTFTKKDIADSAKSTEVILGLSADSREAVDELADKALAASAKASKEPSDLGFMYSRVVWHYTRGFARFRCLECEKSPPSRGGRGFRC